MTEREIFIAALERDDADERAALLDEACGSDQQLRERVELLLSGHDQVGSFLDLPAAEERATIDMPTISEGPGTVIGRYRLLQQIGEGGFGVVFMAEQREPVRRKVALKVIKPGMDTKEVITRFEAERQALALMDHPNIACVFDAGVTESGRPYFAMELVRGVSLTEFSDSNRLSIGERLEIFVDLCRAVQHAHQKGVIHRDLKPSNVMVTIIDNKPLPKIIDFGVSKAVGQQLTERTLFTAYGQMVGTPVYMSPEQAQMSGLDVDTRTDVYSLGVVLYELLTGTTPLDAEKLRETAYAELQRIICEEEAQRPSARISTVGTASVQIASRRKLAADELTQLLRGDLDWIVMKSLEKERDRRYDTPGDLADDIQRFRGDQPIEARPPSTAYTLRKFARRNKSTVGTVAAISLALVIGLIGTSIGMFKYRDALHESDWQRAVAEEARQDAIAAKEQEEQSRREAVQARNEAIAESQLRRHDLYFSDISLAYRLWEENNFHRVDEILKKYISPKGKDYRGFEWRYLWKATERRRNAIEIQFDYVPGTIGYSDDGSGFWVDNWGGEITRVTLSAVTDKGKATGISYDRKVIGTVGESGGLFNGSGHGYASFAIDARGSHAVLRSLVDKTEIEFKAIELKAVDRDCNSCSFDRSCELVAAMADDRSVIVFRTSDGQQVSRLPAERALYGPLALSADGQLLAAVEGDEISVWDVRKEELITRLELLGDVTSLQFSPDGSQFAAGSELGATKARVWDTATWTNVTDIVDHDDALRAIAFSPDGKLLATGSRDGTLKLWETRSFDVVGTLRGHSGIVQDVVFSPDGKQLVSSAQDYTVVIWNIDDLPTQRLPRFPSSNDCGVAYVGGRALRLRDGHLHEFDPATGRSYPRSVYSEQHIQTVAGNTQGEIAIAYEQTIELWKAGERLDIAAVPADITALALSSGSARRVAFGCRDGRVGCWDRSSDTQAVSTTHHPIAVTRVVFSPDGEQVVSGSGSWGGADIAQVMLWDVPTLRRVKSFPGHRDGITDIIFSADGEQIISSSLDNDIRVWDRHGASVEGRVFRGHTAAVLCLLLDIGGKRVISGGGDRTVRIWDLDTGLQCGLIVLEPGDQRIFSMCWSNSGATLAGLNQETGQIYVWHDASKLP